MKRRLRTLLVLLLIATLPQKTHAGQGCVAVDEASSVTGAVQGGVCNYLGDGGGGTCVAPMYLLGGGLQSGNGATSFPPGGSSGGGTSGCNSCGGGSAPTNTIEQGNSAFQLYRIGIPTQRSEQSSFAPGMFSQFDSKMHLSAQTGGTSIVFLNVVTQLSSYFVDGLDGDTQDGVFHDLRYNSAREIKMVNSSGATVTSASSATDLVATHWSGVKEKFQIIDLNPDVTAVDLAGRLTKRIDTDERELTVAYKSWTQTQLDSSPSRQWQIDTVSDSFSNQLTFTYDSTQHGGRWCVTSVARDDGPTVTFTYDSNNLTTTQFADGSQATYAYSQNTANNTTVLTTTDVMSPDVTGVYQLANDYTNTYGNDNTFGYQIPGRRVQRSNHAGELIWKHVLPVNASTDRVMVINAGAAKVFYGNGSMQIISAYSESLGGGGPGASLKNKSRARYVSASRIAVFQDYEITLETAVIGSSGTRSQADLGVIPSETELNGVQKSYEYDTVGNRTKITYTADSTFEKFSYNSFGQVTRKRDRNANVVLTTYDSRGLKTSVEVGLSEVSNVDVQTADYAKTTYEYYPTTHASSGLLKYEMGPLYNSSTPTLYRTDYEYNSKGSVTKITQSPDTSGGTRPVTLFSYNSNNQLISTTNPKGHDTTFTYDSMGRKTKTTLPDGSTEQILYGASNSVNASRVVKTKDGEKSVTTVSYDTAGRRIQTVSVAAIDANILDGQADDTVISDPNVRTVTDYEYVPGSDSLVTKVKTNGAVTEMTYDYQNRPLTTKQYPRVGKTLTSTKGYEGNQLLFDEDPYGRRKYYGYRASDGTLIRTITCTVPEQTFANFAAVWSQTRDSSANAKFIIHDAIRDANGRLTQIFDGLYTETRMDYDSQGRETNKRVAYGTSLEARTETVYNAASQVTEVRSPRYFDSTDTNGYQKAREQWTYNGRGKVATHIVSPGTADGATESYTYDLAGHQETHTDFGGNVWSRIEDSCCEKQTASVDPLGHGTITNTDSNRRSVHTAQVSEVSTHVGSFANPTDSKTLSESTTRYDAAGRPAFQTTWLAVRGSVDTSNPPIAGLNGVSAADGLTTQYLYDNNLADGVGLDNSTGVSVAKLGTGSSGTFNVTLANAISKLAGTVANGGAGITFDSGSPGRASVTINAEDEISFSISDAAGRAVMSGKLNNYRGSGATAVNTVASWSCQLHDATASLSGYGTVLVTQSIDALGNSTKTWTDAAGRTVCSIDQLAKSTFVTYNAGSNQLTVRDPNNVGADMVYDSLGRNTQRTDTFGDVTKTELDKAGNAVKQIDAKNKATLIAFDSRNRRKSTMDRNSVGTTFSYLSTSQLASLTDGENQTTVYTYDARGSKLTEQYPDHTSGSTIGQPGYGIVTFAYDKAGRVSSKQDQQGDTCTYGYDLASRMTSRNYRTAANSPSGTIADTDTFTFDRSGRMLTAVSGRYTNTVGYAYDPAGRKASESLTIASQTYTIGSEFNARNELIKVTYPDGSISNRAYNARGGLSELKLDSSVIDTRSYDDGGRLTSEVLGNGITETRSYRTDNLLSGISYSNTNIGNLGYSWDANKNKTAETIGGVMSDYGFTSSGTAYDDEDRLTGYQRAATSGSAVLAQSWSLTSVGDWSSVTTNGTAVTRTHGPTHELLTSGGQSVTTDVKGNQTVLPASLATQAAQLGFTWDFDNKMKSSDIDANGSADVTFEYDALGKRVARTQGSTAVVYLQADQQTIADYPRGGSASTATYRYVFGSYIDEPVVRKTTGTSGTVLYFHRNQQYSIYALTDSSGAVSERYAYTAYGQPTFLNASATVQTSSAAGNRYTYTAREWDATLGLHHFRARWMSGLTGRFLTRDPIGFDGGEWSLYEFCGSMPLFKSDPTGLRYSNDEKLIILSNLPDFREAGQTITSPSMIFLFLDERGEPLGGWPPGIHGGFPMPIERCFRNVGPYWPGIHYPTPEERYGNKCAGEWRNRDQNCGQHNLNCMKDCDKILWPYIGYKACKDKCDKATKCCNLQGDDDLNLCLFNEGRMKLEDYDNALDDIVTEHKKAKCRRPLGIRVPHIKQGPFNPNLF